MLETLETRRLCTAFGGWAICASAGIGVGGVEVCVGNQGVTADVSGSLTPWVPADVGVGYGIGWDGDRFAYTEVEVEAALGPAGSASVGTGWDGDGNVFSSTAIGAGAGIEWGDLGAAVTYEASTDWSWWPW